MFEFSSIDQYHSSLKEGQVSCLQAVEHYLQQIDATRHLNAFVHVFEQEAIEKARALDEQRKAGKPTKKLHGVVIGIKDVIAYKDHPLSAASTRSEPFFSCALKVCVLYLSRLSGNVHGPFFPDHRHLNLPWEGHFGLNFLGNFKRKAV